MGFVEMPVSLRRASSWRVWVRVIKQRDMVREWGCSDNDREESLRRGRRLRIAGGIIQPKIVQNK